MGTVLSIDLPGSTKERLDALASKTNRSTTSLAAEAIDEFVQREHIAIAAIERGRAQLRDGQSLSQEEVFEQMFAIIDGEQPAG